MGWGWGSGSLNRGHHGGGAGVANGWKIQLHSRHFGGNLCFSITLKSTTATSRVERQRELWYTIVHVRVWIFFFFLPLYVLWIAHSERFFFYTFLRTYTYTQLRTYSSRTKHKHYYYYYLDSYILLIIRFFLALFFSSSQIIIIICNARIPLLFMTWSYQVWITESTRGFGKKTKEKKNSRHISGIWRDSENVSMGVWGNRKKIPTSLTVHVLYIQIIRAGREVKLF